MEHFFELIAELLFGLAKSKPDKMPSDISYNPIFCDNHRHWCVFIALDIC